MLATFTSEDRAAPPPADAEGEGDDDESEEEDDGPDVPPGFLGAFVVGRRAAVAARTAPGAPHHARAARSLCSQTRALLVPPPRNSNAALVALPLPDLPRRPSSENVYVCSDTITEKGLTTLKEAWETQGKLHSYGNKRDGLHPSTLRRKPSSYNPTPEERMAMLPKFVQEAEAAGGGKKKGGRKKGGKKKK